MSEHALTGPMLDVLVDQGNRILNDTHHEILCCCDHWPASCVSGYRFGQWDTYDLGIAIPAIITRYEELKNRKDEK